MQCGQTYWPNWSNSSRILKAQTSGSHDSYCSRSISLFWPLWPHDRGGFFPCPEYFTAYIHFIKPFFLAHIDKMQGDTELQVRIWISEWSFYPEMTDIVKLDFLLIILHDETLWNKPRSWLVDVGSLHNLVVVVLLRLLIWVEVLSVRERMCVHWALCSLSCTFWGGAPGCWYTISTDKKYKPWYHSSMLRKDSKWMTI